MIRVFVVLVFTATWPAWNGTANPAGTIALTPEQVLKIAYPDGGARMDSALVRTAAADHRPCPPSTDRRYGGAAPAVRPTASPSDRTPMRHDSEFSEFAETAVTRRSPKFSFVRTQ
jgi:hypothetical protein